MKDRTIIEDTLYNGQVEVVYKKPEFMRDMFPCFGFTILMFVAHIVQYYSKNNMLFMFFLLFYNLIGSSAFNMVTETDNFNLSKKVEKVYHNDWRFLLPLYSMVFFETLNWIWCLIVVSDKVHFEHPWFHMHKLETYTDYLIFSTVMGWFTAINTIAGHELIHRR